MHHSSIERKQQLTHHPIRSEEHTSELQSRSDIVCRLLLEKKKNVARSTAASDATVCTHDDRPTACPSPSSTRTSCRDAIPTPIPTRLFFFYPTATTEIYTLSLHDALPI